MGVMQRLARAVLPARRRSDRVPPDERKRGAGVVGLVRNDLGRIAETGTVHVPQLFTIERYPTVWQMTSTVRARTRESLERIFQALFPPASITGVPKRRAMEII